MIFNISDFFSILEGALGPFGWGILLVFSSKFGKESNENVSNIVQTVSRVTCSHIILNLLTLN